MFHQSSTNKALSSNISIQEDDCYKIDQEGLNGEITEQCINEDEIQNDKINKNDEIDFSEPMDSEKYVENITLAMLDYEKQIFLDMAYSDGLVIFAKGMNYDRVLVNLIKVKCVPHKLILVVNSSDYEEKLYLKMLGNEFTSEVPSNQNDRQRVYNDGGVLFISTRVLVVDLLKRKMPIDSVIGIFVLRAHCVIESCQVAFALRLYRQSNKNGFIKAFSNNAEAFTYGYGHIERVMRNLFIRELYVWPRFHTTIQKSLKPFEPQVIELHIPMSSRMTIIQTHILDLMNYTVKEIKRTNRYLDLQEITVENCVTKKFHKLLQVQLDSVWHQLSSHTKLLISDLKVLRGLMMSTIYGDSVTLYSNMKKYRSTDYAMANSGWILQNSAEKMFKVTKERVFNSQNEFEPEVPPKWKALLEILRVEIPADLKETETSSTDIKTPITVLILCQDGRTCYQLSQCLTQGGEKYLLYAAMKNNIPVSKLSTKFKNYSEAGGSVTVNHINSYKYNQTSTKHLTSKNNLFSKYAKTETNLNEDFTPENKLDALVSNNEVCVEDAICYKDSYILTMSQLPQSKFEKPDDEFNAKLLETAEFETFIEMENLDITAVINNSVKPIVCIQTFKCEQNGIVSMEKTLSEIDPKYVILYNTNVTAIRQIEIFEARRNRVFEKRLKVFFLLHAATVEEQSYLTSLRREKQAFELLINTRVKMVVPEYQDGKEADMVVLAQKSQEEEESSRYAGGQAKQNEPIVLPKIVVDIREFRSELPCLIHRRGIDVVPVMISVGDYILTPDICVERKSISDLIGSLNSGRLYNQCIQMTRFYIKPILLIEFDQNKPFHLQSHYMISEGSISNTDITQKLQLLTVHFPKLKLVWSPNPYATAKLFEELKLGKPEPDSHHASVIGSDEVDSEVIIEKYNSNIYDFLLKLPGVNSNNVAKLMKAVKNLKELVKLTQNDLTDLLNGKENAKMLWEILHINHKPIENETKEKIIGKKTSSFLYGNSLTKKNSTN